MLRLQTQRQKKLKVRNGQALHNIVGVNILSMVCNKLLKYTKKAGHIGRSVISEQDFIMYSNEFINIHTSSAVTELQIATLRACPGSPPIWAFPP